MKTSSLGYNVAVVGSSSLLGKELASVLEERKFPVARLVNLDAGEEDPELPILDLGASSAGGAGEDGDPTRTEMHVAFLAARPKTLPAFLKPATKDSKRGEHGARRCWVIDLGETLAEVPGLAVAAPALGVAPPVTVAGDPLTRFIVAAHPAAIVVGRLLLSLSERFEIRAAVAEVFIPASQWGARAIEELQKQTVSLLSFQTIPRAVFGAQLAFNLLPRFSSAARSARRAPSGPLASRGAAGQAGLATLEGTIRDHVRQLLHDRTLLPALRVVQAAVYHSLAVSLYVELAGAASPQEIAAALTEGLPGGSGRIRLRRASEPAPSPVEAAGSSEILLDAILPDAGRPGRFWLWVAVDNLRVAAENAVDIAELLQTRVRHSGAEARTIR